MTTLKTCQSAAAYLCLAALLVLACNVSTLRAQDPDDGEPEAPEAPEPRDPRVVEIEVLKAIAEAQASIAESRAKVIKAALPDEVEPLDGSMETEGDPIEAVILTYNALQKTAETFRGELAALDTHQSKTEREKPCGEEPCKKLFIHSTQEVDAILRYQGLRQRLEFLKLRLEKLSQEFDNFAPTPDQPDNKSLSTFMAGVVPTLSGLLGASLDVISLFRTNIEIKNTPVSIEEQSLVAALLNKPVGKWKVYYPSQVPPSLLSLESSMVTLLAGIDSIAIDLRTKISKKRAPLDKAVKDAEENKKKAADAHAAELKKLQDALKEAEQGADPDAIAQAKKAIEDENARYKQIAAGLDAEIKNAKAALESYDDTTAPIKATLDLYDISKKQLLQPDEESGNVPFDSLIRAEKLYQAMDPNGYLLALRVIQASGSEMKKKNLWTPQGARLFHKGGVVVSFVLYEPDGSIVGSGLATEGGQWKRADLSGKTAKSTN